MRDGFGNSFIWASGIEDSFVPHVRGRFRALDEYALIGHYEHWREDLALARDAGLSALRWGVPWYRVEPEPGQFDWTWIDQVIPYIVDELGLIPIIDLVHYGCPLWLHGAFANPTYPSAVARYAAAFAHRYRSRISYYTPLNEPSITAHMCGKRGVWPPYRKGERGYVSVMLSTVDGIIQTSQAIKQVAPEAILVHVEAASIRNPAAEHLMSVTQRERWRAYLSYDLLSGRVTPDHGLHGWLLEQGASETRLDAIARSTVPIDIMGLNFYPQWSAKVVDLDGRGRVRYLMPDQSGGGFEALIEDHYRRYGRPIMITETSAYGPPEVRAAWLHASLRAVKALRQRSIPIVGYTWFPLFTMIDWAYRTRSRPLDAYYIDLGLYALAPKGQGSRWRPLPLLETFKECVATSQATVGHLQQV